MVRLLVLFALPFAALSFDSSAALAAKNECRDALARKSEPDPILNAIPQDPGLKGVIALIRDREAQARASEGPLLPLSKRTQRFRAEWLPHLKAERGYREALTRSMESDLRIRSSLLKKKLAVAARQGQLIRYDAVIVGASVAGLVTLHKLLAEEPTLRVLIVDSSDTAGANFRYAGDSFNINSSNRASGPGRIPLPGRGNINELPGLPIQVSDLSPVKYPSANDLGTALVAGLYSAVRDHHVDVLFSTDALGLSEAVAGSSTLVRTKLEFAGSGNRNVRIDVESGGAAIGTGFGKPSLPATVARNLREFPALVEPGRRPIPRLLTFEDVMRLIAQTDDPRKLFAGRKVAVVGTGDSANVFIEFLLGYATSAAYGISDAQTVGPSKIIWVGQSIRTCEEFIAQARSRYAQIGTGFRNSDPTKAPVLVGEPGRLEEVSPARSGRIDLFVGRRDPVEADLVVLATGFEGQLRKLLGGLFPEDRARYENDEAFLARNFEFIEGATTTSERRQTRIGRAAKRFDSRGRQITGRPRTIIVGPAAGKLPRDNELVGIVQNSVSIFNNAPRTAAAARRLLENLPAQRTSADVPATLAPKESALPDEFRITGLTETRALGMSATAFFQGALASLASRLELPEPLTTITLRIVLEKRGTLRVSSPESLDIRSLVQALAESREFFNQAATVLRNNPEMAIEARLFPSLSEGRAMVAYDVAGDRSGRTAVEIENFSISLRGIEDFR